MNRLPLYFRFDEMVLGNGFLARVRVDGRATAEIQDDESVWIFGVFPGGLAEVGPDLNAAFSVFRHAFRAVLVDIATEKPTFKSFKAEVERFVHETNDEALAEWEEARRLVRAGHRPTESMPHDTADRKPGVKVVHLELQPSENRIAEDLRPLVAA
jgi:hypothetical protein